MGTEITPIKRLDASKAVNNAIKELQSSITVKRVTQDGVCIVFTGRCFADGTPVDVRVWIPESADNTVIIGDGGRTYSRLGEAELPMYALSVRNELLEHLPVQSLAGQVVVFAKESGVAEAINILTDSCLMLDTAVVVANHMRPKNMVDVPQYVPPKPPTRDDIPHYTPPPRPKF